MRESVVGEMIGTQGEEQEQEECMADSVRRDMDMATEGWEDITVGTGMVQDEAGEDEEVDVEADRQAQAGVDLCLDQVGGQEQGEGEEVVDLRRILEREHLSYDHVRLPLVISFVVFTIDSKSAYPSDYPPPSSASPFA